MLEAYSVAVKLNLINHVTPGLAALAAQFTATDAAAKKLQARLTAIKTQFMAGAGLFVTGAVMAAPIVYSIGKAAELQKQLIAVQIATRGTNSEMVSMRRNIESIASQTIFSNVDVAKMGKLVATGTGLGAGDVSRLLPAYAKFADVQYLMKGTNYEQSVKDAVRLAHAANHYDPASLGSYLNLLTKASLIVPGGLNEVGHALKYSQGMAKGALGISDENMVLLTALLNRLGFAGSRGGTNLIAAMTRTIPGVFGSGLLKGKSAEALAAMGMVNAQGYSKFFKGGNFDAFAWMGGLGEYVNREMARHPEAIARQLIMRNFQHAFGVQGSRVASLLSTPQAMEQLRQIGVAFQGYGGVDSMQERFANESVQQKMINAKTNFQSLMTEIGYTLLPVVNKGLTHLNNGLKTLIAWVTDNPGKVKAMAYAFSALSASLMFGGVVNLVAAGFREVSLAVSCLLAARVGIPALVATLGKAGLVGAVGMVEWSVSTLIPLLGKAGLVGAAGAAGWAIGNLINRLAGIEHGELGSWLWDKTHNEDGSSRFFSKKQPATTVHTTINLDGKRVADNVTYHQVKAMSSPRNTISRPDSSMNLAYPGLVY